MSLIRFPCGECGKEVEADKAIQCDGECQQWFHAPCMNVSDEEYDLLSGSDRQWKCSTCSIERRLPPHNAVDVFHFDFQQNLPTPKLTVGKQFYLRLLWTYLFGIYCASTQITVAFMWHELMAKRGANDVISCLAHFIFSTAMGRTGARWSIWWADNCPGQNYVVWFFQDLIRRGIYSRIDYKFLVVGHIYLQSDWQEFWSNWTLHFKNRYCIHTATVVSTCSWCSYWSYFQARGDWNGTILISRLSKTP